MGETAGAAAVTAAGAPPELMLTHQPPTVVARSSEEKALLLLNILAAFCVNAELSAVTPFLPAYQLLLSPAAFCVNAKLTCCLSPAAFCVNAELSAVSPFFPVYAEDYLGASAEEVGVCIALYPLAVVVTGPAAGWGSTRFGRGAVAMGGAVALAAGTLLFGAAATIYGCMAARALQATGTMLFGAAATIYGCMAARALQASVVLFGAAATIYGCMAARALQASAGGHTAVWRIYGCMAARVLQGVGQASLSISTTAMMMSVMRDDFKHGQAVQQLFVGLGYVLGPILGGAIYDACGFEATFLVLSIFPVALAIVMPLLLSRAGIPLFARAPALASAEADCQATNEIAPPKEFWHRAMRLVATSPAPATNEVAPSKEYWRYTMRLMPTHEVAPPKEYWRRAMRLVVTSPAATACASAAFLYSIVFGLLESTFEIHAAAALGVSSFGTGLAFALPNGVCALTSLLTAPLVNRFGYRAPKSFRPLSIGACVYALALLLTVPLVNRFGYRACITTTGVYALTSLLTVPLVNRFGYRACITTGLVIMATSVWLLGPLPLLDGLFVSRAVTWIIFMTALVSLGFGIALLLVPSLPAMQVRTVELDVEVDIVSRAVTWVIFMTALVLLGVGIALLLVPSLPAMQEAVQARHGVMEPLLREAVADAASTAYTVANSTGEVLGPVVGAACVAHLWQTTEPTCIAAADASDDCESGFAWTATICGAAVLICAAFIRLSVPARLGRAHRGGGSGSGSSGGKYQPAVTAAAAAPRATVVAAAAARKPLREALLPPNQIDL
ncbi:major facilitator superfamily domain-containing protein [Tribonema minus]|uniref:Major facilitator superfamily domain-containing protein n=1 Tax=Tribonema minus TaxID=303371 RepID=A0A835YHV4_9STRA|nr:major facilitator superfamily domain-containing protein [Tribonema minus]